MTPRSRTRMGDDAAGGMGMAPVSDRSSPGARMLKAMGGSTGKGKGKARDYGDRYLLIKSLASDDFEELILFAS